MLGTALASSRLRFERAVQQARAGKPRQTTRPAVIRHTGFPAQAANTVDKTTPPIALNLFLVTLEQLRVANLDLATI
jgi:hypothetical protein